MVGVVREMKLRNLTDGDNDWWVRISSRSSQDTAEWTHVRPEDRW